MTTSSTQFKVSYDDAADVLYMLRSGIARTQNVEASDGLVLRYDAETHAPVGATVVDFYEHWDALSPALLRRLSRFLGISPDDAKRVIGSALS